MRKALTDKSVKALKPKTKRYEVHDVLCPGFSARVSVRGTIGFSVKYRYGVKQKRLALGRYPRVSLAKAREKAMDALRQVDEGIDPATKNAFIADGGSATFHPKLYYFRSGDNAEAIVGSSNFTVGGLSKNWEACIHVKGTSMPPYSGRCAPALRHIGRSVSQSPLPWPKATDCNSTRRRRSESPRIR